MSNHYLDTIGPDKLAKVKQKAEKKILDERHRAAALRIIGEKFNGAYVTKRIEEKLKAAIPEASNMYLYHGYCKRLELHFCYGDRFAYNEYLEIYLCDTDTRRIDGERLLKDADAIESGAREKEKNLALLDKAVAAYNDIAEQYARIYGILDDFLYSDIPMPDYELKNKYKDTDPFQKPTRAPKQDTPALTFEEFSEAVSAIRPEIISA